MARAVRDRRVPDRPRDRDGGCSVRAQLSLTVAEGKRLIARAISSAPEVRRALRHGRILLKGGTTVSAVAEALVGAPLRISGRISPRGTQAAQHPDLASPHTIVIERGEPRNVDHNVAAAVATLGPGDVAVLGANIIDAQGHAAMMAGRTMGGVPGRALAGLMAQGARILVAAGLEKLTRGSVGDAIRASGMAGCDWSLGMPVGLMPIVGRLVTEVEALELLSGLRATVIGRGGIDGAEGGVTLAVQGPEPAVRRAIDAVLAVRGATTSGAASSWPESGEHVIGAADAHPVLSGGRPGQDGGRRNRHASDRNHYDRTAASERHEPGGSHDSRRSRRARGGRTRDRTSVGSRHAASIRP